MRGLLSLVLLSGLVSSSLGGISSATYFVSYLFDTADTACDNARRIDSYLTNACYTLDGGSVGNFFVLDSSTQFVLQYGCASIAACNTNPYDCPVAGNFSISNRCATGRGGRVINAVVSDDPEIITSGITIYPDQCSGNHVISVVLDACTPGDNRIYQCAGDGTLNINSCPAGATQNVPLNPTPTNQCPVSGTKYVTNQGGICISTTVTTTSGTTTTATIPTSTTTTGNAATSTVTPSSTTSASATTTTTTTATGTTTTTGSATGSTSATVTTTSTSTRTAGSGTTASSASTLISSCAVVMMGAILSLFM
eukprot:TRINITY_DN1651_c16_g1_i1.p1 TRINITY_DN1651_c16_g1~~TRINITY_DN1651_c16_g1_i1.p1  ORF type:complete len:310 (-),score=76.61 TRINITY_DN1651_c16_g1_i1:54-983(-)